MDLIQKQQAEIDALKSKLEKKEEEIISLKKRNEWYIEKLKLRLKEKFGASSEKADPDQLSFFDLFHEAETLREPVMSEPDEQTVVPAHPKKKAKRGAKFDALPVETIVYQLPEEKRVCEICGAV